MWDDTVNLHCRPRSRQVSAPAVMEAEVGLWILLFLLLLSWPPSSLGCEKYRICSINCCSVTPSCADALGVDCECPDLNLISIRQGDISPSVQSMSISTSAQVTFEKYAFYNLSSLSVLSVDLSRRGSLNVDENGLAMNGTNNAFFLKIAKAKDVIFSKSTFTGVWNDDSMIEVKSVQCLHIEPEGFALKARNRGPRLNLEHIRHLYLAPNALKATISELEVRNVSMPTCWGGSFGGKLSGLRMENVNIDCVREGCINSSSITELSIISCDIKTVKSRGFSGEMRGIKIQDTTVAKIENEGFNVRVSTFSIKDCRFGELIASSFTVNAEDSVDLEDVDIETLRKHALISLNVLNDKKQTHINDLCVIDLEEGSLALSKQRRPLLTGFLNVPIPDPKICPIEHWVLCLVGKRQGDLLNDADKEVINKLRNRWLCPDMNSKTLQNTGVGQLSEGSPGCHLGVSKTGSPRQVCNVSRKVMRMITNSSSEPACKDDPHRSAIKCVMRVSTIGDDASEFLPKEPCINCAEKVDVEQLEEPLLDNKTAGTTATTEIPNASTTGAVPGMSSSISEDETRNQPEKPSTNKYTYDYPQREDAIIALIMILIALLVIIVTILVGILLRMKQFFELKIQDVSSSQWRRDSEQGRVNPAADEHRKQLQPLILQGTHRQQTVMPQTVSAGRDS